MELIFGFDLEPDSLPWDIALKIVSKSDFNESAEVLGLTIGIGKLFVRQGNTTLELNETDLGDKVIVRMIAPGLQEDETVTSYRVINQGDLVKEYSLPDGKRIFRSNWTNVSIGLQPNGFNGIEGSDRSKRELIQPA